MFCNKCGNEIKEGQKFCNKCGAPVGEAPKVEAPKVEAPKVEAPKVEAPKVSNQPVYNNAPKKKSMTPIILAVVVLVGVGAFLVKST